MIKQAKCLGDSAVAQQPSAKQIYRHSSRHRVLKRICNQRAQVSNSLHFCRRERAACLSRVQFHANPPPPSLHHMSGTALHQSLPVNVSLPKPRGDGGEAAPDHITCYPPVTYAVD